MVSQVKRGIQAVCMVFALVGLSAPALPKSPCQDGRLQCRKKAEQNWQELLHNREGHSKPMKLIDGLEGSPACWRGFLQSELASARLFAEKNADHINAYISSVLSCPDGEGYGFKLAADNAAAAKGQYERLREKEDTLAAEFQKYIRSRNGLCAITVLGRKYELFTVRYQPSTLKSHNTWLERHSAPPLEASPLLSLAFGQSPAKTSMYKQSEIEIYPGAGPETMMTIQIPVFFQGHYVCEIWLHYCSCKKTKLRGQNT